MDPATEKPPLGATEEWEICNFTMDAHPIHVHLVEFEVTGRAPMTTTTSADTGEVVCSVAPSTGPRRIANLIGSTRLGGLLVHRGTNVIRSTATEIRNGITHGDQKWIEDDLLEASKSAAEAGALPGAVVLQIPKIAGSRTIVGQGLTVVEATGIELLGANRTLVLQGGLRLTDVTMTGSLVGGSLVQIMRSTIRSV